VKKEGYMNINAYTAPHPPYLHSTPFNPLNTELNPICHLLALLGTHHIHHVSRIGVKYIHFLTINIYTIIGWLMLPASVAVE